MFKKEFVGIWAWKWLLFLLLAGPLVGCSSKENKSDECKNADTSFAKHVVIDNVAYLPGVWGTTPGENATFQITKDTIYYPDADRRLFYVYKNGKIICFDEANDTNFICTVITNTIDSLVLKDDHTGHVSKFIRFP